MPISICTSQWISTHIPPIILSRGIIINNNSWDLKMSVEIGLLGDLKTFERRDCESDEVVCRVVNENAQRNRQCLPTTYSHGNQSISFVKVCQNGLKLHLSGDHSLSSNNPADHCSLKADSLVLFWKASKVLNGKTILRNFYWYQLRNLSRRTSTKILKPFIQVIIRDRSHSIELNKQRVTCKGKEENGNTLS